MNYEALIASWIELDTFRRETLAVASELNLNDWCLSAGFLRNLVWDNVLQKARSTPLNDIDLVYYNTDNLCPEIDKEYESQLFQMLPLPWSVKNQARMHTRNGDLRYGSTSDAMSFWPEIETAGS